MRDDTSVVAGFSNAIVRYAAIVFAFLIPLFVFPAIWVSIPQSKALLAAGIVVIALIAWLVGSVAGRRMNFSLDPILVAALLLPVAYAVSAYAVGSSFSSFVSGDALSGTVASMLLLFGAALLGAVSVEDRRTSLRVMLVFIFSGGIVLLFQVLRIFIPDILSLGGAMIGNTSALVGSWHDLGIFAALMLIISYGFVETSISENRVVAALLHSVGVLSLAVLTVVNFADVWYSLAGAAFLFAIARILRTLRRQQNFVAALRSAVLWLVLVLLACLSGYYATFVYGRLPAQLQISQTEVRPSLEGTFAAGQNLYQGGKSLVFGSGPNTFDRQWALFKPAEVNATNFWNTEFRFGYGVVPTAIVTVGVVGSVVWALLALALLWAGFRSFKDESEGRLRVILFIAGAFLLFYHIIYVPSIGISLIMFLLLGLAAGLNAGSWRERVLSFAPQGIAGFALVLVLCCVAIGGALMQSRAIVSNLYTARAAELYQRTGNLAEASSLVRAAVSIDPQNDVAQRAAVQIGLLQFEQIAKSASTDEQTRDKLQTTLSETIAHGLRAVSIDDSSYQNWLALAGLYQSLAGVGIQGAYEQAESAWKRAASTTPANPLPFLQLGQLSMVQSKNPEAKEYFAKAIALKPDLALPYYLRSQILAGEQRWQEAVNDAAAAAQLANQDPLSWYSLGVILYAAGDYQNAGVALEKAVSLQNNYSDAIFALAVIYDKLGEHTGALAAAQKVVELNPNEPAARTVLKNIQENKPALDGLQGQSSSDATSQETEAE